jgi:hypothetical protein
MLIFKRQEVKEFDYYIAWPSKMEPIYCPETSVTNYQTLPRNISEKRRRANESSSIAQTVEHV